MRVAKLSRPQPLKGSVVHTVTNIRAVFGAILRRASLCAIDVARAITGRRCRPTLRLSLRMRRVADNRLYLGPRIYPSARALTRSAHALLELSRLPQGRGVCHMEPSPRAQHSPTGSGLGAIHEPGAGLLALYSEGNLRKIIKKTARYMLRRDSSLAARARCGQ